MLDCCLESLRNHCAGPPVMPLHYFLDFLGVTALGKNVSEAQARAYQAVDLLDWPSGFCRRDIGWRALDVS